MRSLAKKLLTKRIGVRWDADRRGGQWWTSERLRAYVDRQISPTNGGGVVGALQAHLGDAQRLSNAISVGAGNGTKELRLVEAGLVENFELYELSEGRADEARQLATRVGLEDRVRMHVADAFAATTANSYDLVYWDHSLHHMMDVDEALSWSVQALNEGGVLVVNDYVGPPRLQWYKEETNFGRQFLAEHSDRLGVEPSDLRYRNLLNRAKQTLHDPSEAPQSHLIQEAYQRHCGSALRPLGAVLLQLCAKYVTLIEDQGDPLYDSLIEWDQRALEAGYTHFALAIWQKPTPGAAQ